MAQREIISDRMSDIVQMPCGRRDYSIFEEVKEKKVNKV